MTMTLTMTMTMTKTMTRLHEVDQPATMRMMRMLRPMMTMSLAELEDTGRLMFALTSCLSD